MFESTQHPRTLDTARAQIDAYYTRGFRNIRIPIPITWTESVGGDTLVNDPDIGDVNRSHERLAVIEQVVDYALSIDCITGRCDWNGLERFNDACR